MARVCPVTLSNRKALLSCGELWKSISGFPAYQVSTFGRVRRVKATRAGVKTHIGKILKPRQSTDYDTLTLFGEGGGRQVAIHTIVAEVFIGPKPKGKWIEVNHIDTNKRNNRLDNLEYLTKKRNMEHAVAHGLTAKGEAHGHAKLTEKQVIEIRKVFRYIDAVKLAKGFGVSKRTIEDAWYRKTWRHLP